MIAQTRTESENDSGANKGNGVPRVVWLLVAGAFVLRMGVSLALIDDLIHANRDHWGFGYELGRVARSLAQGNGFSDPFFSHTGPTSWVAPMYALLLAGVFKVFGIYSAASAVVIKSLDSLFAALTIFPAYLTARKIFDAKIALAVAWAWLFFPFSIFIAATSVWDTCLGTLLLTTAVWLTLEYEDSDSWKDWIWYGLVWGIGILTTPAILTCMPFCFAWVFWRRHTSQKRNYTSVAAAAMLTVLVLTPWLMRDYVVFHRPILIKSNLWVEAACGNIGSNRHWWHDEQHPSHSIAQFLAYRELGEMAYMDKKKADVVSSIKGNPGTFVVQSLRRFVFVWTGYWSFREDYLVEEDMDLLNIALTTALTVLALFGIRKSVKEDRQLLFPSLAVIVVLPLIYYVTHPDVSYRHPIDPTIVMFATVVAAPALAAAWEKSLLRRAVLRLTGT